MTITNHIFHDSMVIRFYGVIDYSVSPMLDKSLQLAYGLANRRVIFNLKEVTSIEGSGLGTLCFAFKTLRRKGFSESLVDPPVQIREIVGQSELRDEILIYNSEIDARKVA